MVRLPGCRVRPELLDRVHAMQAATGRGVCDVIRLALELGLSRLEADPSMNGDTNGGQS
ncbi:MAG: hypothetical protein IT537_04245 [Hyphomicrobiales bacterium]|nr:hypothetical protein [Hyphomicrobiales bacterium]